MEQLLKCAQPALVIASDHLIDLVDRVMERYSREKAARSRSESFFWLCAGLLPQGDLRGSSART